MAAGQVQRVFGVLEAYPARPFSDDVVSVADYIFGHTFNNRLDAFEFSVFVGLSLSPPPPPTSRRVRGRASPTRLAVSFPGERWLRRVRGDVPLDTQR